MLNELTVEAQCFILGGEPSPFLPTENLVEDEFANFTWRLQKKTPKSRRVMGFAANGKSLEF